MSSIKFEAYQISVYCDTVYMILKQHTDLSIVKLLFFAYAINKERFFDRDVYNVIETSKSWTDKRFMREVLHNV